MTDKEILAETEKARLENLLNQALEKRQILFADYDAHALMYQRLIRLGNPATDKLTAWDTYAEELRAIDNTPNWFLDPQWPTPPEA